MNPYETCAGFCPICPKQLQEEYSGTDEMILHLSDHHKYSEDEAEDEAFAWADRLLDFEASYREESHSDDIRHFPEDYR